MEGLLKLARGTRAATPDSPVPTVGIPQKRTNRSFGTRPKQPYLQRKIDVFRMQMRGQFDTFAAYFV